MRFHRLPIALTFVLALLSAQPALALVVDPPGNRHSEQPPIPGASVSRTKAMKTTFDGKYAKIRELLSKDHELIAKIKSTASTYGIAPIHIIGALVGEHTYNVDVYERLQSYYMKAASYAGLSFAFEYKGESIEQFVTRKQFADCADEKGSYALWSCRERVWDKEFRGETVDGVSYPDNRFSAVFFQPFYAGQTFGLGQINPLTALKLTDLVAEKSGYPRLTPADGRKIYEAIMDPDVSLAYVAAAIRQSIDDYKSIAGVDVSKNPGITATLYNVGNTDQRAAELARRMRAGQQSLPEENYYGWLINEKLSDLEGLL